MWEVSLRLRVSFTEESRGKEARLTQGRSASTAIRIKINGAQKEIRAQPQRSGVSAAAVMGLCPSS